MPSIAVRDELRPGRAAAALVLDGLPDRLTARELIRWRVREEVAAARAAMLAADDRIAEPSIRAQIGA